MSIWNCIIGFVFISALGTVLHFLYPLSGRNKLAAFLAPVNESVWEHLKLGVTATLIWTAANSFFYHGIANLYLMLTVQILILLSVVPAIFYTYTGILKRTILPLDILSYYVSVAASQAAAYFLSLAPALAVPDWLFVLPIAVIVLLFLIFTYFPPRLKPFLDPKTGTYGAFQK